MESLDRFCECKTNCDLPLNNFRADCKIHPYHRAEYNRRKRQEKALTNKKEHSKYKNDLKTACIYHHLKHPFILTDSILIAESLIEDGFTEYGYKGIWIHLRCKYKRDGKKISMPNNFVPFFTDLVKSQSDELHGLFHTNKRKNS